MINLPYFKQDTEYSCGPVVMQMVLRFYGKVFSEKNLIDKLKTQKNIGTHHQAMIDLARTEGFYVYVNNESSFKEIIFFNKKMIPVIVHYIEPDSNEEHYAIVVEINKKNVILYDPWNGEKFEISHVDFEQRWFDEKGNHKKWIMVITNEYKHLISNKDRHLGKQYLPKG